jgi:hypothetical protein
MAGRSADVEAAAPPDGFILEAGAAGCRLLFALLLFSLAIPSWTQDVSARCGERHPDLAHSALYPRLDTAPKNAPPERTEGRITGSP